MSDIKLNDPAAGKIPQYVEAEALDNAPEAAQRPSTSSAAESPAALMRQYLALLTCLSVQCQKKRKQNLRGLRQSSNDRTKQT